MGGSMAQGDAGKRWSEACGTHPLTLWVRGTAAGKHSFSRPRSARLPDGLDGSVGVLG